MLSPVPGRVLPSTSGSDKSCQCFECPLKLETADERQGGPEMEQDPSGLGVTQQQQQSYGSAVKKHVVI